MAMLRKYRLSDNTNAKDVYLRQYKDEIEDIINEAVPGKHPKVYKDHSPRTSLPRAKQYASAGHYPRVIIWRCTAGLSPRSDCLAALL